jgi:myosin heavy subunit
VCYNVDNWLEKNKDPLNDSIMEQLTTATNKLIRLLFAAVPACAVAPTKTTAKGNGAKGRSGASGFQTVSAVYKTQLTNLLKTLNSTSPHFVRCIVPNHEKVPLFVDGPLVLHQLK